MTSHMTRVHTIKIVQFLFKLIICSYYINKDTLKATLSLTEQFTYSLGVCGCQSGA